MKEGRNEFVLDKESESDEKLSSFINKICKGDKVVQEEIIIKEDGNIMRKQIKLLLWKNLLIFVRNIKMTIFLFTSPIFACLLLVMIQLLFKAYAGGFVDLSPKIVPLKPLAQCITPVECNTIGYGVISTKNEEPEYIRNIMKEIAYQNHLAYGKDVKLLTVGSYDKYLDYINEHLNQTQYGVIFCIDKMNVFNLSIPCGFEESDRQMHVYTIMYNMSNIPSAFVLMFKPKPTDDRITQLKLSVDNAYLSHFNNMSIANGKNDGKTISPKITMELQGFPITENRFLKNTDMESGGTFYFFIPSMICFVVVLLEIIREKDLKLRKSLLIIGLDNTAFWISWVITAIIISLIMTIILLISGAICQFKVFLRAPIFLDFLLFFFFTLAMLFVAFFLSTILHSLKSAYTVSFAFILIGLIMELFLSDYIILYSLYTIDLDWWIKIAVWLFQLYPPYNFSKVFDDISVKTCFHFDTLKYKWIEGPGYKWKDLFVRVTGKTSFKNEYDVPPTYQAFILLIVNILMFSLLAWYFDHVDETNRGKAYHPLFFCQKKYWRPRGDIDNGIKKSLDDDNNDNPSPLQSPFLTKENEEVSPSQQSVHKEYIKVKQNQQSNDLGGLLINGLEKVYTLNGKCCEKRQLHALKPTYLDIPYGELFTLLGKNGAGKSTLINILTGNLSSTAGEAKISTETLSTGFEQLIGLCPQHDILWNELTAYEHIELYASIRNIPNREIAALSRDKLKQVNLFGVGDDQVSTYSGGMKRRLSILLSTIGNQKIIFLDEPTTGLDPVNRRFIWKMIQNIKQSLSVILTTHSMEEADYLSDRIGVIKNGEMKCIGTPLELKKMYGTGYLITFICNNNDATEAVKILKDLMPSGKIVSSSGGAILMNLPFDKVNEMKYFTMIMNNQYDTVEEIKELKGVIRECGLNSTTIEEIFLKITKGDDNEQDDDISEITRQKENRLYDSSQNS